MTPSPTSPKQHIRNCTLLPALLTREELPSLRLAELKLLLIVVDQTLGRTDPQTGRRKEIDWLTHSQLKARTGCASEAVSHAIDALVRRDLIVVLSDAGQPLPTPQERRRCAGRLFFRLSDRVLAQVLPERSTVTPHCDQGVENPVDNSLVNDAQDMVTHHGAPNTETRTSQNEPGISEIICVDRPTENRKPKTTDSLPDGNKPPIGGSSTQAKTGRPGPRTAEADPDVRRFLAAYAERFQAKSAGEPPLIHWARDGRQTKLLLRRYPFERLVALLDRFFGLEDDWVRQRGYSLAAFQSALNQLLVEGGSSRKTLEVRRHTGWARAGGNGFRANPVAITL